MTPQQLLAHLDSLGITLRADGGKLRVSAARGTLTDEIKAAILESREALLSMLTHSAAQHVATMTSLGQGSRRRASDFQQRLWILQQIDRSGTHYNLAHTWWAPQDSLDAPGVLAAIGRLLARHEILRSTFHEDGGTVYAVPAAASAVPIEVCDLAAEGTQEQRKRIGADLREAVHAVFDLVAAPPLRFIVYRLATNRVALTIIAHHIAVDEWSMGLIRHELLSVHARSDAVDRPALQFHDFIAWQHQTADAAQQAADLDWWVTRLRGAPAVSAFPPDRTAGGPVSGGVHVVSWDKDFAEALQSAVRRQRATLFMSMLAACAAVLRWYTGQTDLVFGIPMGTRERTECETMIGPFVNLLLVRLDVSGDLDFAELLRRARDATLEAHAHSQASFESILERLNPARSLERMPLFQIALLQHQSAGNDDTGEVGTVIESDAASGGSMHELTWFLRQTPQSIECVLEYRSNLYSPAFIERLAHHLELVLRRGAQDSSTPLSQLCTPGEFERRVLVETLNATGTDASLPLLQRFETWASRQPARVAISHQGHELSYGQLSARVDSIARLLRSQGAGPGQLVAVLLPRNPDLVAVLLAILKCGAAYLPLDPQFPAERIRYMLEDSGSDLLVVAGGLPGALPPIPSLPLLDLLSAGTVDAQLTVGEWATANGSDTAYLIYTSGSTGRPKGVVISRRSLDNLLNAMMSEPGLTQQDLVAATTTVSFDIAGAELFLPLVAGAQLELVSRETASSGQQLAQLLDSRHITVLQATPSTWWMLLEADWRGRPDFRAWCGGESLAPDLAEALLDRVGELWNLYGPTETTIWSSRGRVTQGEAISIGRPLDNTQIYIVGSSGELLPFGIAGEIWIGGHGVATGYHNREELTAERFVEDRFGPGAAKLYRTGDLGRWRVDGRLEHLGRADQQVKIRGFRIELEEVEAALRALPEVEQAVAAAVEAGHADRRLVAYLHFRRGEDLTASDVRRQLRQQLPEYMVPSLMVTIDAMPLTANGKIDRAALPDPFRSASARREFVAPAEGMERLLAAIWQEVLKVQGVSAHDNFFDLGGHSLLSLKVAAAVRDKSGWSMDPRLLFFNSLQQIAAAAETTAGRPAEYA